MPWGVAAAAVVGAYASNQAANKAANASQNATNQSIGEQQREFDINQNNQRPWLRAGKSALAGMQALNSGDFSSFHASPDYQYTLDQGIQGLDRSAAARGNLLSGGHSADILKFASGLADQQYGNYYNRLAQLAGLGQGSAQSLGAAGQQMAGNIGNLLMGNAAAQGQNYYNQANNWNNLLGQGAQMWGQYQGSQQPTMTYNSGSSASIPSSGGSWVGSGGFS